MWHQLILWCFLYTFFSVLIPVFYNSLLYFSTPRTWKFALPEDKLYISKEFVCFKFRLEVKEGKSFSHISKYISPLTYLPLTGS